MAVAAQAVLASTAGAQTRRSGPIPTITALVMTPPQRASAVSGARHGAAAVVEPTVTPVAFRPRATPWLNTTPPSTKAPLLPARVAFTATSTVAWTETTPQPIITSTPWLNSTPPPGLERWLTATSVPPHQSPSWMPRIEATPTAAPTPGLTATPGPVALDGRPLADLRIVLDPGHGGRDPGALHSGWREAAVNLAVAEALRSLLEQLGSTVLLTRADDSSVMPPHVHENDELQARADAANRAGADLLVSIHADASADPQLSGVLTFFGPEEGYPVIADRSPRLVARSYQFARSIQRELVDATGQADHGVRSAPFWVIGGARMPAALVEVGFLTNDGDAGRLAQAGYRERVANGIARGIIAYLQHEDDAIFVRDLTIPDGTRLRPGQSFTKTWLLRNVGKRAWSQEYRLAHRSGEMMATAPSIQLPDPVAAGAEVAVSAAMVAPPYLAHDRSEWQLQDPDGEWIGDTVWAEITLEDSPHPTDRAARIDHPDFVYFEETGHNLGFAFRRFFEAHGGVEIFGYPRTEEFKEGGRTVQYFQAPASSSAPDMLAPNVRCKWRRWARYSRGPVDRSHPGSHSRLVQAIASSPKPGMASTLPS